MVKEKEQLTVEIPAEMLGKEKINELDTIFQKLEAEVRKPYRTKKEQQKGRMIEWSSKMTGYEIMLLEQAVLIFQNLILHSIKKKIAKEQGNEGKETQ